MGGGGWSTNFYRDREAERKKKGEDAFAYHSTVTSKPASQRKVHADLDPKGVVVRESRDSEEHPESNAVAVFFDVTGSMGDIPRLLQQKLPNLMDTLNTSQFLDHPQVFFGAVGDTTCDRGSLQVGQFESDNRVNAAFECMWLEGGGGGSMHESYQNAMYFAARHMVMDCWEKRQKKGYLFLIGDELPYDSVNPREVEALTGTLPQAPIPIQDIIVELQEKFHVFMIRPLNCHYGLRRDIQNRWKELLGAENVLHVEDMDSICEVISMVIGIKEGRANLLQAKEALQKMGSNLADINVAAAALAPASNEANVRL